VVAVLSPYHHPHPGQVLSTDHAAYRTPLGEVPVAASLVDRIASELRRRGKCDLQRLRNDPEHSLEIELPFLQRALSDPFSLVPIMLADQSAPVAEALGHALASVLQDQPCLLVASSDLSHYYPDAVARRLDQEMLERIRAFDPVAVLRAEEEGAAYACGRGAIAAALWAAKDLGGDRVRILHYANSGDVTGDYNAVVGYGAAVILRSRAT
jgi:AmmeMemoRadiSam system protein B